MKPIKFKNSNKILKAPKNWNEEEQCEELTIYSDGKQCVSCWRLSFFDRLSVLIFGKVWLYVMSEGTQPPVALIAKKEIF